MLRLGLGGLGLSDSRRLKLLLPIIVVLAGIGGIYAIFASAPVQESRPRSFEPPRVEVIRVTPQPIRLDIRSQGVAAPRDEIDLAAEVAGKVVAVHPEFLPGGFFEAGEKLLSIDPRDYEHAIVVARARIAEAERQVAKEQAEAAQARRDWGSIGKGRALPYTLHEPQLAEARARLKAAEADLAKARLERERCDLFAPFAGRVLSRTVGPGQYVQLGESLGRIYATDLIEVRLPVSIEHLNDLDFNPGRSERDRRPAPTVVLRADIAGNERRWEGRISRAEARIDDGTGLLYLVAEVRDPYSQRYSYPLISGMFVRAEIEGKIRDSMFVLPPSAVNASDQVMLVDRDRKLRIRPLSVLRHEADRILVDEGLSTDELVVVGRIPIPVDGMTVIPEFANSASVFNDGR